jgi:hypothetical protein
MRWASLAPDPWGLCFIHALCLGLLVTSSSAETVRLIASADNTLIESVTGERSNGAGPAIFVGRTSQARESLRRGLLYFDVAAAIPPGAIITRAELSLVSTPANPQPALISVHRALSAWGEGTSSAAGGSGALAAPGDATWIHTFYAEWFWSEAGGDFVANASMTREVGDAGLITFDSTPEAVDDVQTWLDRPIHNHGWVLLGGESAPTTSKRFASREAEDPAEVPQLLIEYQQPCETLALEGASRALCRAYCEALDCDGSGRSASSRACEQLTRRFARYDVGALICARSEFSGTTD